MNLKSACSKSLCAMVIALATSVACNDGIKKESYSVNDVKVSVVAREDVNVKLLGLDYQGNVSPYSDIFYRIEDEKSHKRYVLTWSQAFSRMKGAEIREDNIKVSLSKEQVNSLVKAYLDKSKF